MVGVKIGSQVKALHGATLDDGAAGRTRAAWARRPGANPQAR